MSAHPVIKITKAGKEFPIDVELTQTIAELKEQIAGQAEVPKENIRLVCAGKIWQDVATVGSYQPSNGAIVHCLNNPPRTAPAAAEQTLSPVNPMQAMLGGGAAPAPAPDAGGDPFAQMMAQSQQMMQQNPEMMQQLMDSPMVQQMMSDPETMRAMMSMNPQMQQLMEQRPEIARMLEDPDVIRQSMQMMRNPSLMREMQRNQDLSIGRLDAMPGGHNALVRAHEELIDPVMSAFAGSGQDPMGSVDVAEYTQQIEGGPNNAALPNPWGAPAASPSPVPVGPPPPVAAPAFPMFGAPAAAPAAPTAPGSNPMAAMMQQLMSNPAMMQQSMQLAQQMQMGSQMGTGGYGEPAAPPQADTANSAAVNPFAAMMAGGAPQTGASTNPMAAMMQQMMSNPALMQQSMQMAQMMGNQQGGGFPGAQASGGFEPPEPIVEDDATARVRFAGQLAQLSAMGFCNEAACLRALQQHGRVDAAIDTLLQGGSF